MSVIIIRDVSFEVPWKTLEYYLAIFRNPYVQEIQVYDVKGKELKIVTGFISTINLKSDNRDSFEIVVHLDKPTIK